METETFVHADLDGEPVLVGRLWSRMRRDRESASFEYDREWLSDPRRFSLGPALNLGPGPFHTASDRALFGPSATPPPIAGDGC